MANTLTADQINTIYQADLGRPASTAEQGMWVADEAAGMTSSQVIADIVSLPEAVSYSYAIVRLYQATFGRIPDQAGFIVNTLAIDIDAPGGGTITFAQIEADFAVEQEFINKYGAPFTGTTSTQPTLAENFITELYQNVLQRTGSTTEVNNWLATGDTAAEILNGFVDSQEFVNDTNSAVAALLATNALDAILTPPESALTGSGSLLAINLGSNTTITINSAGGSVNAGQIMNSLGMILNALMSGDNLQDTAGDGTLNLSVAAAANPSFVSGVTISGFSTLNFTNNDAGTVSAGSAGFEGNVTGLQTVNDTGSIGNLTLGAAGQGIDPPSGSATGSALSSGNLTGTATGSVVVSTVNVTGYAGPAGSVIYAEFLSAAAGALGNSIAFSLSGALGTTVAGGADVISVANDGANGTSSAPNLSYGTQTYSVNSAANLQLQAETNHSSSVDGTRIFVFAGTGNVAIGQDFAGDHQSVTTIDASATAGSLYITGGAAGNGSNALSSAGNPGGAFGSAAGFLNDPTGFALTTFKLGSGVDTLDISSATATQVGALTTLAGATTASTNEIIVGSAVVDTTTSSTFANIKGFSILGDVGAGGTINLADLPSSINDIFYQTAASGALAIDNQTAALTVDTEANGAGNSISVGVIGPAPGLADSFTLIIGDTTTGTAGAVGAVTAVGDEVVTIISQGAAGNTVGTVTLTPSSGGNEQVAIGGNQAITIGSSSGGGVAAVTTGGALIFNHLSLTITDSKAVTLVGATGGGPLFEPISGDTAGGSGAGDPLTNSTNAQTINATGGGLIMQAGDANFTTSATVAGSAGDTISGSPTSGNVLGGSIGNDTIVGNTTSTAPDTIYTGGGADTITLAAGHTAADHIGLYAGFDTTSIVPGGTEIPRDVSITDDADVPQLGWWGQATGATATGYAGTTYAGLAANTGTSLDQTVVANFVPGNASAPQDVLDFAVSSGSGHGTIWGAGSVNGDGGLSHGLVNGDLVTTTVGTTSPVLTQINPSNTAPAPTAAGQVFELTTGVFANASAVATALHSSYQMKFTVGAGGLGAHDSEHILVAYQDLSGNAHIADVALTNTAAVAAGATETTTDATVTVHASDIVQLTGVALLSLHTGNINFV